MRAICQRTNTGIYSTPPQAQSRSMPTRTGVSSTPSLRPSSIDAEPFEAYFRVVLEGGLSTPPRLSRSPGAILGHPLNTSRVPIETYSIMSVMV